MIDRRKFLTTVALGTASAAFLSACGPSSSAGQTGSAENPVTINYTWWGGNDDRAERTRKAIALFESKNPDIKVNGNFTDFAGYWQKRATEAAGGGLPDVMQWDLSYLRDYGQRNQLLDLGTVKINTEAFDKSLLPRGRSGARPTASPPPARTPSRFTTIPPSSRAWASPSRMDSGPTKSSTHSCSR